MRSFGQFRRYGRMGVGAMIALLIAGLLSTQFATPVSADASVTILNFKFDPTPLTVTVGSTVTWTNLDTAPHSATSDKAGVFDTGLLQKGQSGKITFKEVGTFTYFCTVHPNMHGSVIVVPVDSTTTTTTTATSTAVTSPATVAPPPTVALPPAPTAAPAATLAPTRQPFAPRRLGDG